MSHFVINNVKLFFFQIHPQSGKRKLLSCHWLSTKKHNLMDISNTLWNKASLKLYLKVKPSILLPELHGNLNIAFLLNLWTSYANLPDPNLLLHHIRKVWFQLGESDGNDLIAEIIIKEGKGSIVSNLDNCWQFSPSQSFNQLPVAVKPGHALSWDSVKYSSNLAIQCKDRDYKLDKINYHKVSDRQNPTVNKVIKKKNGNHYTNTPQWLLIFNMSNNTET